MNEISYIIVFNKFFIYLNDISYINYKKYKL